MDQPRSNGRLPANLDQPSRSRQGWRLRQAQGSRFRQGSNTLPRVNPVPFQPFGAAHLVAIAVTVLAAAAMVAAVRRSAPRGVPGRSTRLARILAVALAVVLLANQVLGWIVVFMEDGGAVFVREHLPLHLCGASVLLSAVVLLTRHRLSYELVYFWGLAGAGNALVTPELVEGWPEYHFIRYFVSHGGIVAAAAFATWGMGMRPTLRSLLRAFAAMNVMAVVVGVVNLAFDANYMYLSVKPEVDSPFLQFEWPWYIVWLELMGLLFFLLAYLPVGLEQWAARARGVPASS